VAEHYSFRWLADRIASYGWVLQNVSGRYWYFVGRNLQPTLIEVEERRVGGRIMLIVRKSAVDVFDESIKENFGETLFDGTEEEVALD
jgi:hypothetical protein